MSRIGFIGLGNMGTPMAVNLARAGHATLGFDLSELPYGRQERIIAGEFHNAISTGKLTSKA